MREKAAPHNMQCLEILPKRIRIRYPEIFSSFSKQKQAKKHLPSTCPYGKRFVVDLAVSCMKGGFVHRRHDEVHDLFATLLKNVCHDVEVELHLQTLTAEKFNQQCQFL